MFNRPEMKLRSVTIKNYRGFGDNDADSTVLFKGGYNIIVGENNAGKSSILRALDLLKNQASLGEHDYHGGDLEKEVRIELGVELEQSELLAFLKNFIPPQLKNTAVLDQLARDLGNEVSFFFSSTKGRWARIKNVCLQDNCVFRSDEDFNAIRNKPKTAIYAVFNEYLGHLGDPSYSLERAMKEGSSSQTAVFATEHDQRNALDFLSVLQEKLKSFDEIRRRPEGQNHRVLESYDGALVADVLATLKMGNGKARKKWELVKSEFNRLFPNLSLEVTHEETNKPPTVVITKVSTGYETPVDHVGAGIGQMLILLTHLIASEGMVFGLDMPELHLHPHAQRLLLEILIRYSQKNQIIVVTHSPMFVEVAMIDKLILLRDSGGNSVAKQLPQGYFSPDEMLRLQRCLDLQKKELVFSRGVFIVEGETELGAMPILARAIDKDFDTNGITVVRTGKHFGILAKLLNGLGFQYTVMVDKDAMLNIEGSIRVGETRVETSPVFVNLDSIGALNDNEKKTLQDCISKIETIEEHKREYVSVTRKLNAIAKAHGVYVLPSDFEGLLNCGKFKEIYDQSQEISDSKVSRGIFCGQEIARKNMPIPKVLVHIIDVINKETGTRQHPSANP